MILTSAHVIVSTTGTGLLTQPASAVYVQFDDGDRVKAEIIGWDPYDDVGVLRVPPTAHALMPVPLGTSAGLTVGQPVATIGSPFGAETSLSIGVVSGVGRTIPSLTTSYDLFDAIQTDAPINQGNSGGPLLDAAGRAIGINAQIRSSLESGFEGVAFAVPIDSVKRSLEQLLSSGHVDYAYLGLQTEDLTPVDREGLRLSGTARRDRRLRGEGRARGCSRAQAWSPSVLWQNQRMTVGGDAIVAIDGIDGDELQRRRQDRRRADGPGRGGLVHDHARRGASS